MNFLDEFKKRGMFHQCTNISNLSEIMARTKITAYIGFDCTAPSLHVGSLLQIMILRLLQKHGHTPIVLLGGGTTRIGDPSGKDDARKILSDEEIEKNRDGIKKVLSQFLDMDKVLVVDNGDWINGLNYVDFLRTYGKHFSVNKMLSYDSVKSRLEREQNLSFLEFNYMLLQAYDFVELYFKYNCILQIGGSDQWGNIINGMELLRKIDGEEGYGLTTPLITTANGSKMGKTASGAVWLDNDHPAYDYWQFWRNTDDKDVIKFLKFFTEIPLSEIDDISNKNINELKVILANEATKICFGEEAAILSSTRADKIFKLGLHDDPIDFDLGDGIKLYKLILDFKYANSGNEAKKIIAGGGVRIDEKKVTDITTVLTAEHAGIDGIIKITIGGKKHLALKVL